MRIEKKFFVPTWDEARRQKAVGYWSQRHVVFSQETGNTLVGERGNLLGNLVSYDMSRLIAKLSINVSKENEIHCILDVNTFMQIITERNKEFWRLEMETFESYLLYNNEQPEIWREFTIQNRIGALLWTMTFGLLGNRLPSKEDHKKSK